MQLLKSVGDGIGTAAGVAWPIFGIVFGTLALTIGISTTTIILSSISIGLFFLVALPITYWSYKNHLKEKRVLKQTIDQQENQIRDHIYEYIFASSREYLFNNKYKKTFNISMCDDIKQIILNDVEGKEHSPQVKHILNSFIKSKCFESLLNQFSELIDHTRLSAQPGSNISINIKNEIKTIFDQVNCFVHQDSKLSKKIKIAIIGFSSAFGSIAGCSAGIVGLLVSVGVFAGLAALPFVGWTILALSLIFGLAVASVCVYTLSEKDKETQLITHYKNINTELEKIVLIKNIKIDARIEARRSELNTDLPNISENNLLPVKIRRSQSADFSTIKTHRMWSNASSLQSQNHIINDASTKSSRHYIKSTIT